MVCAAAKDALRRIGVFRVRLYPSRLANMPAVTNIPSKQVDVVFICRQADRRHVICCASS